MSAVQDAVNPIYNSNVALDGHIIADMLGLFLRCDPEKEHVDLPDFRLLHLCEIAAALGGRIGVVNATILESIGAIYCLSLYCAGMTSISHIPTLRFVLATLQTVAAEALACMNLTCDVSIVHTRDRINEASKKESEQFNFITDTFANSYEVCKDILRDITRQVRSCREKTLPSKKKNLTTDCMQPHSVYLMCVLGLSHACTVLSSSHAMLDTAGMLESMLLFFHLDIHSHARPVTTGDGTRKKKQADAYRFDTCIEYAVDLAFIAIKMIPLRYYHELRVVCARFVRCYEDTRISFAMINMEKLKQFLAKETPADMEFLFHGRQYPASNLLFEAGVKYPDDLIAATQPIQAKESIDEYDTYTKTTVTEVEPTEGHMSKELQELSEIWKLPEYMRWYYLVSRPLREYTLTLKHNKALKNRSRRTGKSNDRATPQHAIDESHTKTIENAYQRNSRYVLSRLLNPTEGCYWTCLTLLDYLHEQIKAGNIFADLFEGENTAIEMQMRQDIANVRKRRIKGISNESDMSASLKTMVLKTQTPLTTLASQSPLPSRPTSPDVALLPKTPQTESRSIRSVGTASTGKLSLADRLQLAKIEADLERKLDKIDMKRASSQHISPVKSRTQTLSASASAVQMESMALMEDIVNDTTVSRVWQRRKPPPKPRPNRRMLRQQSSITEESFKSIPQQFSMEYAMRIRKLKESEIIRQEKRKQDLDDQQEIEVGKLKTFKQLQVKTQRDKEKKELNDSLNIKREMEEQLKEIKKKEKLDRKQAEKEASDREEREMIRLKEIKALMRMQENRRKMAQEEREEMEKIRLQSMADAREYEEIIRRVREEQRMKHLEEVQRSKEERRMASERAVAMELEARRAQVAAEKEKLLMRVRRGNFMYHQGRLGFYEGVRDKDIPYIMYEDADGIPYYYDPITGKSDYKMPKNFPIRHHTEQEAIDYDKTYGAGSYDALMAERAWKMQCNQDGGYFDEEGRWIPLDGYYDENYEFVSYR